MKFYDLFLHLRLQFNLVLIPIFLFGFWISCGQFRFEFWTTFFVLHIPMCGGANALNSFYDKDEGPIGGLERPPRIDNDLFYFAWFIKLFGFFVSLLFCPTSFTWWYVVGVLMSVAYSHPLIRLKGSPLGSAIVVAVMQGFGAFTSGWIAGGTPVSFMISLKGLLGVCAVISLTLGMYPLTQLYQFQEDLKRGDKTLAIFLGIPKSFSFAKILFSLGLGAVALIALLYSDWMQAGAIGLYAIALHLFLNRWAMNFKSWNVLQNFHFLSNLTLTNSTLLLSFLILHFSHFLNSHLC